MGGAAAVLTPALTSSLIIVAALPGARQTLGVLSCYRGILRSFLRHELHRRSERRCGTGCETCEVCSLAEEILLTMADATRGVAYADPRSNDL